VSRKDAKKSKRQKDSIKADNSVGTPAVAPAGERLTKTAVVERNKILHTGRRGK